MTTAQGHRQWMKERYGEDWGESPPAPPPPSALSRRLWRIWYSTINAAMMIGFIIVGIAFLLIPHLAVLCGCAYTLWRGVEHPIENPQNYRVGLRDVLRDFLPNGKR